MSNDLASAFASPYRAADPNAAAEGLAPSTGSASADMARSTGLATFRLNAFRVLRLKVSAAANEAVWKSEKILARRRAGLDDPDEELIAWLPSPDEIDLREAAQRIEEPLRRLRDQLLWFDFEGDPRGPLLRDALATGYPDRLAAYLALTDRDLPSAADDDADPASSDAPVDYEAAARKRQMPLIAHRLNQANLRLLLAFSWMHGIGPQPPENADTASRKAPNLVYATRNGLTAVTVQHVHALFPAASPEGRRAAWPGMLRDALGRWGALLKNPWLSSYVESAITALDDDLVTSDDVEPLTNAIATALADAVVGEMKLMMLAGAIDRVLELVGIATESGIDPTHWTVAFRPVRALFRAELDELATLLDPDKPANLRSIALYLQRVGALGATWAAVDTDEAFGLDQMIDAAVNQAIDRVRSIENASAVLDRIADVLNTAAKMAKSPSTAERAREMARNVGSHKESLCAYCGTRSATAASSGVLRGKKEISRERIFNGVRITYSTTASLVLRCETCAKLHGFFRRARNVVAGATAAVMVLVFVLFQAEPATLFFWATAVGAIGFAAFAILTSRLTPKGEPKYSNYTGSEGYRRLRGEGYNIDSFDYSEAAGQKLMIERGIV